MEEEFFEKSKSQKKREVTELQKLGEKLVFLSEGQLSGIDIDEELKDAVRKARGMKRGSAKKRQLQYIGVFMRKIDIEPIKNALSLIENGISISKNKFKTVENWRNKLIDGTLDIDEIIKEVPFADRQKIRQLVRNSHKEKNAGKPAKSSKNLYRYLKELFENKNI